MMERMEFERWMCKFENELVRQTGGFTTSMLPDWDFWGAWDSDMEVKEAVEEFLEDIKDY